MQTLQSSEKTFIFEYSDSLPLHTSIGVLKFIQSTDIFSSSKLYYSQLLPKNSMAT